MDECVCVVLTTAPSFSTASLFRASRTSVCGSPVSSHHSPHTHTPLRMKTLDGRHAVPTGQVLNCIATDIGLWPLAFVDIHLRFSSNPSGIR